MKSANWLFFSPISTVERIRRSVRLRAVIMALVLFSFSQTVSAQVTVTTATGGTGISADKALNGGAPTYTTLGNIVITETVKSDFATTATRIRIPAPSGWKFKAATGTISKTGSNLTLGTTSITADTVFIPFTISGTNQWDAITISGLQVIASDGANVPNTQNLYPIITGSINGLTGTTSLGVISQAVGTRIKMVVTLPGESFTDGTTLASSGNTGTPTTQTVGVAFNLLKLTVTDQFLNIDTSYKGLKVLSFASSGTSVTVSPTSINFNAGVSSTTISVSSTIAQTATLTASDGTITGPAKIGRAHV